MHTDLLPTYILVIGFLLDALIGDPYSWPHPVKVFGNLIYWSENRFNQGQKRKQKGALFAIACIVFAFVVFNLINRGIQFNFWLNLIVGSVFVFYGLANHMLIKESLKVLWRLEKEGVEAGRNQLKYIVGRDTSRLNPHQIRTAVLETLSENLSDGVIAPLFYYAIGGIPLMFAYKMINTLDSMIGYKSERYKQFGMLAAKIDDVANFIPARLTALLMVLVTFNFRGLKYILKYGNQHASPNAGYPESALAGILNCRFGGPNVYHGQLMDKPYIGENPREVTEKDIIKAAWVNVGVSVVMVGLIVSLFYFV